MCQHTPGPWHTDGWENIVVNDQWGTTILCCAGSSTGTLPEIKANAALIAAAPAMYAESKTLCSLVRAFMNDTRLYDGQLIQAIHNLETALAQAEGRG